MEPRADLDPWEKTNFACCHVRNNTFVCRQQYKSSTNHYLVFFHNWSGTLWLFGYNCTVRQYAFQWPVGNGPAEEGVRCKQEKGWIWREVDWKWRSVAWSFVVMKAGRNDPLIDRNQVTFFFSIMYTVAQLRTEGGFEHPPPQIPKALQNRAKLNPIVKTVKNC